MLFHRINDAVGALLTPLVMKIIVHGVKERTFETFDPVGVADILHRLGGATHGIVARAIEGKIASERETPSACSINASSCMELSLIAFLVCRTKAFGG